MSKLALPAWIPPGYTVAHKCALFVYEDDGHFGLLSSSIHWWCGALGFSLGGIGNINYSPTDVFETFPQPFQTGPSWDTSMPSAEL